MTKIFKTIVIYRTENKILKTIIFQALKTFRVSHPCDVEVTNDHVCPILNLCSYCTYVYTVIRFQSRYQNFSQRFGLPPYPSVRK